nr:TPA_exp: holocytochrome c synthase [Anthoceros agrestis]
MGNAGSVEGPPPEKRSKSVPDRVHDLYYKAFPGADCPVTGAAREKLLDAACSREGGAACSGAAGSSGRDAESEDSSRQGKYKHPHVYDVYGRRIDPQGKERPERDIWVMPSFLYYGTKEAVEEINPLNRMPKNANQTPAPGQEEVLSTYRQKSSIPKGGTEETWMYPSPQMFFNSLVRKGKADDVSERDMEAVVTTHNAVNESTWNRLLQWERLYSQLFLGSAEYEPRLLYFKGRPHDLSPKAHVKKLLGYGAPFDRHDWTVDRGGREMRYVIDFYYDDNAQAKWPFVIDVRPALDSVPAALLRARMLVEELAGKTGLASPLDTPGHVHHGQPDSQQTPAA